MFPIWGVGRCGHCGKVNPIRVVGGQAEGKCVCSKRHVPGCAGTRAGGRPCRCRMVYAPHHPLRPMEREG